MYAVKQNIKSKNGDTKKEIDNSRLNEEMANDITRNPDRRTISSDLFLSDL